MTTQSLDPEVSAMSNIAGVLSELDPQARQRVVRWVIDRSASDEVRRPRFQRQQMAEGPPKEATASDVSTFFHTANPTTDAERALVVGYWLQVHQDNDELEAQRVNSELKNLGFPVGNITRAFNQLTSSSPRLAMQIRKEGKTKQA